MQWQQLSTEELKGKMLWGVKCPEYLKMPPRQNFELLLRRRIPQAEVRDYGDQHANVFLPVDATQEQRASVGMHLTELCKAHA